ncbi:MAG: hypothetical protein Q9O62_07795 [Ardenticatenia bacterium]|nr:hypothetical protein [Ardenticatenia bacterium]
MTQHRISPDEAREALELVERTTRQMRRAVAHGGMPYFLIIWGIVWTLGFGGTHVLGPESPGVGTLWLVLDILGIVASVVVGWRVSVRVRSPRYNAAIGLYWLAWIVYGGLLIYFARPQSGDQLSLLVSLFAMFGYVTTGIFYRSLFLGGLGATVTVFMVVGYLLFPAVFNLWMALLGGGSLIAAGLYMRYAWR